MARFPHNRSSLFSRRRPNVRSRSGVSQLDRGSRAYRRLLIDQLEERAMLSVSPLNLTDQVASDPNHYMILDNTAANFSVPAVINTNELTPAGISGAAQSIAVDDNGDFVITWTGYDSPGIDAATGMPWINPVTGQTMTEKNVYAQYFTDAVQQLDLTEGTGLTQTQMLTKLATDSSKTWQMSLNYGLEVQKISISAATEPYTEDQSDIDGTFKLSYVNPATGLTGTTAAIPFYETTNPNTDATVPLTGPNSNAYAVQTALQALPGLAGVTVVALDAHDFSVTFPAQSPLSLGTASAPSYNVIGVPEQGADFTPADGGSGFLPAVTVSETSHAMQIANIPISTSNAATTATAIQQYFVAAMQQYYVNDLGEPSASVSTAPVTITAPSSQPVSTLVSAAQPEVTVIPHPTPSDPTGLLHFDITFGGDWGKLVQPAMTVGALTDAGNELIASPEPLTILKESSGAFRVNAPEAQNPALPYPSVYDNFNAGVGMDADGDFVITWEGDSLDPTTGELRTDIYARRFSPTQYVTAQSTITFNPEGQSSFLYSIGDNTNPNTGEDFTFSASATLAQVAANVAAELGLPVSTVTAAYGTGGAVVVTFSASPTLDIVASYVPPTNNPPTPAPTVAVVTPTYSSTASGFWADDNYDGTPETYVQCVAPQGSQFRVNTSVTNNDITPTVAMDPNGDFVIAWATRGTDIGFFNGVMAQRFDRYGDRVGNEMLVNTEDTNIHLAPRVAMDNLGDFAITWGITSDTGYLSHPAGVFTDTLNYKVYDANNNVLIPQTQVVGAADFFAPIAFDANDNFVITWDQVGKATDNTGGEISATYAEMWQLYKEQDVNNTVSIETSNGLPVGDGGVPIVSGGVLRTEWRVNSADATMDTLGVDTWPNSDDEPSVGLSAAGDITIAYQGFGPDVSDNVDISSQTDAVAYDYFTQALKPYPTLTTFFQNQFVGEDDIQNVLKNIMVNALDSTNPVLTSDDIGILQAVVNEVGGLLSGEADAVMYSQFDAAPQLLIPGASPQVLNTNSVANTNRDGTNAEYIIDLSSLTAGGSFVLQVTNGDNGTQDDVTVNVVSANNVLEPGPTAQAIETALDGAEAVGKNWPQPVYEGPVVVSVVSQAEIDAEEGTAWDVTKYGVADTDYVFDVLFQGEVHDTSMDLNLLSSSLVEAPQKVPAIVDVTFNPNGQTSFSYSIDDAANPNPPNPLPQIDTSNMTAAQVAQAVSNELPDIVANGGSVVGQGSFANGGSVTVVITDPANPNIQAAYSPPANNPPTPAPTVIVTLVQPPAVINPPAPEPNLLEEYYGNEGTDQEYPDLAMQPNGSYVMAWTEANTYTDGTSANDSIEYRQFSESANTAGPLATNFIQPDGNLLSNDGEVTSSLEYLVVTFDEPMLTANPPTAGSPSPNWVHSVTNPANWSLLVNGVPLSGGIAAIYYGLNESQELATQFGLDVPGDNTYDAVLVLNAQGKGATNTSLTGYTPLGSGQYEVMALTSLRDAYGNPLGRTGYQPNGQAFTRSFNIVVPTGGQTLVSTLNPTLGGQYTRDTSPQCVASDANGDTVAVWTNTDAAVGPVGVYAKLYQANWAVAANGTRTALPATVVPVYDPANSGAEWPADEICVTSATDADYASVARDATGDFIVTWSQYDGAATGWDVWAQRYDAAGNPLGNASMVDTPNTPGTNVQRNSTVAMDQEGDSVITWQSLGSNGSYAVYAQRYDMYGNPLGGTANTQTVTFTNDPLGTFELSWNNGTATETSAPIAYSGDVAVTAVLMQNQLQALGADVTVTVMSNTQLLITFDGTQAFENQPQINVVNVALTAEAGTGAAITCATTTAGASGAFLVNAAAANNRLNPDVAMDSAGDFAVTWTSYGEAAGDSANNSSIYARLYNASGTANGGEFQVSQTIGGSRQYSAIAMDAAGDFVVTWTSYGQDGVGNGAGSGVNGQNGVYARSYSAAGAALTNEFLVNSIVANNNQYSRVAMDSQGDFTITWEGYEDRPLPSFNGADAGADSPDSYGVYAQRFVKSTLIGNSLYGADGQQGGEFEINTTTQGDQRYPGIAMDATGDFTVVWSGYGVDATAGVCPQDIFSQTYDQTSSTAGPTVDKILNVVAAGTSAPYAQIVSGATLDTEVTQFVVDFSENLLTNTSASSVDNLNNWTLTENGQVLSGGIANVQFGWNEGYLLGIDTTPTNNWEAVVTFNGNAPQSTIEPLANGTYVLTISNTIKDLFGNALAANSATTFTIDSAGYSFGSAPMYFSSAQEALYPLSYSATMLPDGARSVVVPGVYLGTEIDVQQNAVISTTGDANDNGIVFQGGNILVSTPAGGTATSETINVTASVAGYLDAWIDWNNDGVWEAGEQLSFTDVNGNPVTELQAGPNVLTFTVPTGLVTNGSFTTYARFRFSTTGLLSNGEPMAPTGLAPDGEVEDLPVTIYAAQPTQVEDIVPYLPSSPTNAQTGALDPLPNGEVEYLVTFSKEVTNVNLSDFYLTETGTATGTLFSISPDVNYPSTNQFYEGYDVYVDNVSGNGNLLLNLGEIPPPHIVDINGNPLVDTTFTSGTPFVIDQTAPSCTGITATDANPTTGPVVHYQVTFSEAVTNVTASDFQLLEDSYPNGTGPVTGTIESVVPASSDGTTWTVTIDNVSGNGLLLLNLNDTAAGATTITDLAGNALSPTFFTGAGYVVGTAEPLQVVSIVPLDSNPTNLQYVQYAVTFSEPVTGVNLNDFTVASNRGGPVSLVSVTGSGSVYTVTINTGVGNCMLNLNVYNRGTITGPIGDVLNGSFTGPWYTVIKTPPVVSSIVATGTNPTNAATVPFTVTFSEPVAVASVLTSDFTTPLAGIMTASVASIAPAAGSITTVNGMAYSDSYLVIVNVGSGNGSAGLNAIGSGSSVVDEAGNLLTAAFTGPSYTIRRTAPVVSSFVVFGSNPTGAATVQYTVTFSEPVFGVALSDFQLMPTGVSNAAITSVVGTGTVWTVTASTGTGNGTLQLDMLNNSSVSAITDAAGNALSQTGFTSGVYAGPIATINKTQSAAPTVVAISTASGSSTGSAVKASVATTASGATVGYTVTFSEPVTGVSLSNFQLVSTGVTGTALTALSGSGSVYTVTASTGTGASGTLQLNMLYTGTITDASGDALSQNAFVSGVYSGPVYTIQKTVPVVNSIVMASANPASGATVGYTVTFSEAVTGVAAGDFSLVTTGLTGTAVASVSGSGSVYTVTVNTGSGSGTLQMSLIANGSIKDAAGNVLGSSFSGPIYTVRKTAPTVNSIVAASANPASGATVGYTVTFSEAVTNVAAGDFSLVTTGVTGAAVASVSGSGSVYTVTVNTGSGSGTLQMSLVNNGSIKDAAGNALGGSFSGPVYTVSKTAVTSPTVSSIVAASANPASGATVGYTVTFSEAVTNVAAGDFSLVTTGVTGAAVAAVGGSGSVYTVTVNTGSGSGTLQMNFANNSSIQDAAGNVLSGTASGPAYTVSKTAVTSPIVSSIVAASANPANTATVGYTVTFSEAVTGVAAGDFSLVTTGLTGAAVAAVSGSGSVYTVTVNTGSGSGTLQMSLIANGSIKDAAGNVLGSSFSGPIYTVQKTAVTSPIVSSIVAASANPANTATVGYTVTFSEAVTGVAAGDFSLVTTGVTGAAVASVSGSGSVYTVTVNTGGGSGTLQMSLIANGSIKDAAGNVLGSSFSGPIYTVQKTAVTSPVVSSIVAASANPASGATVGYTVTFSEAVTNVAAGDFSLVTTGVSGAAVASVSGSGSVYTVTVNTGSGSGTLQMSLIANGSIKDAAGNVLGSSFSGPIYTVRKTAPTVSSIALASANPASGATVGYTVTFSEAVTNVAAGDFSLVTTGVTGAAVASVSGSGSVYTVTVNTGSGSGTLQMNLANNSSIQDAAGNVLSGTASGPAYTVSKTAVTSPAVSSIVAASANPANTATVGYTVTFSEAVTGVAAGDFSLVTTGVSGAAVASVSGSGSVYTVSVSTGNGNGTLQMSLIANGSIKDAAGNVLGSSFSGPIYTVRKTAPTVTSIVAASATPVSGATVGYTVTFSEAVTGVAAGDFSLATKGLTGAAVASVSGSGSVYTVTVNTGSGSGTLQMSLVANGSIKDAAGNVLGGSFSGPVYTVQKTAPTVSSIALASANPASGATVSYTVTFSEAVTGVSLSSFKLVSTGVAGAALTALSGSGSVYTVTVSTGTGTSGTLQLDLVNNGTIMDAAGNKLAVSGTYSGPTYTVKKTPVLKTTATTAKLAPAITSVVASSTVQPAATATKTASSSAVVAAALQSTASSSSAKVAWVLTPAASLTPPAKSTKVTAAAADKVFAAMLL